MRNQIAKLKSLLNLSMTLLLGSVVFATPILVGKDGQIDDNSLAAAKNENVVIVPVKKDGSLAGQ